MNLSDATEHAAAIGETIGETQAQAGELTETITDLNAMVQSSSTGHAVTLLEELQQQLEAVKLTAEELTGCLASMRQG